MAPAQIDAPLLPQKLDELLTIEFSSDCDDDSECSSFESSGSEIYSDVDDSTICEGEAEEASIRVHDGMPGDARRNFYITETAKTVFRSQLSSPQIDCFKLINADRQVQEGLAKLMRRNSDPGSSSTGCHGYTIQTKSAQELYPNARVDAEHDINPQALYMAILGEHKAQIRPMKYDTLSGFFQKFTQRNMDSFDMELVEAIRSNNVSLVRARHCKGKELVTCNKFGESSLHMCARRGCADIMRYMLDEAKVSLRVVCDSGCTPLHDGCWSARPNFDCIRLMLQHCPDLLLIQDNRGFTPLNYVPRDVWQDWCHFLRESEHLLLPKELYSNHYFV